MTARSAVSGAKRRVPSARGGAEMHFLPKEWSEAAHRRLRQFAGFGLTLALLAAGLALASYDRADPSWSHATAAAPANLLGRPGAYGADWALVWLGLAAALALGALAVWALRLLSGRPLAVSPLRLTLLPLLVLFGAAALSGLAPTLAWPAGTGLGGAVGRSLFDSAASLLIRAGLGIPDWTLTLIALALTALALIPLLGFTLGAWAAFGRLCWIGLTAVGLAATAAARWIATRLFGRAAAERLSGRQKKSVPVIAGAAPPPVAAAPRAVPEPDKPERAERAPEVVEAKPVVAPAPKPPKPSKQSEERRQRKLEFDPETYELPPADLLQAGPRQVAQIDKTALAENARYLESVLNDFGVEGRIVQVRPGPVVTLYELEPAPGVKSARVINLADDIARSMSAVSARVAVVPGRNVIGIELPNASRETVYLRELLSSQHYDGSHAALPLVLGKDIGGTPVIADLARMPHLLIAGTTGSGKSVGINTMILSLLYKLPPDRCKFIMIDPKMLELSTYEGIPHLIAPVVTEAKKAIVALRWAVKEMERRYLAMSKLGVRNVDGFNQRIEALKAKGGAPVERVQVGVDENGKPQFEERALPLDPLPFIVVIVDEMADLMLVAGKDIEAAVQRLAQMARAAGIHLIMATQRPSVDVITGTIKANFPTRVSFQVTSKIDSRTILGEQGAEQLLGQGDMLHMAGGGRITRVHGPFVSESEVEKVVRHLKAQGAPAYIEQITKDEEEDGFDPAAAGGEEGEDGDLYRQAVDIVVRERKASTSFIQRRLQIGYNRAARLIERMEQEGIVSAPNHAGKREILVGEDA